MKIISDKNTNATVVLKYDSDNKDSYFHNQVLKVIAKENSNLNIVLVNFMNTLSTNLIAIDSIIEDNAKLNYVVVDLGGKYSITNYYSNLVGKSSENLINAIYLGNDDQFFDLNYISHLRGEKSNVNIEVQGALKDESKKHFKGTIDFKKGSKKSIGNENESCMLLSDKAKSISLPMLLCSEEDVKGNHSSSAGKIDPKVLFYIMTRGFDLKDAMKLVVKAKFDKILENIEDAKLKKEIIDKIDEKID